MQTPLQVRRLSEADAPAYYRLRLKSLEGPWHLAEPEILGELSNGASGLVERLIRYESNGMRVWGVFDQTTLAGVAAVTLVPLLGDVSANLWGVFVLRRYRGTAVSRLLMEAVFACCEQEWNARMVICTFAGGNAHAEQFLRRFGFEFLKPECSLGAMRTMVLVYRD